jgi:hypothetical protein
VLGLLFVSPLSVSRLLLPFEIAAAVDCERLVRLSRTLVLRLACLVLRLVCPSSLRGYWLLTTAGVGDVRALEWATRRLQTEKQSC